mmetsp:Transcript_12052/g.13203  ORF Transcript_12052/g.13203 Transcript_12052/m.13203 type:complete len:100 (+) Transcript_12052:105-404(+)|eukprot:CAMPEP_0115014978 /NCGR_PEP_ID=MMETSP0216-20121206/26448_1 /TAXON_ID=223996 /ORGANISM="Protocruzia adherens, Strain Boccale" /LENGTH=99 /DNA_ID=CAMNT_0002384917 /DNA_START=93 /DNA_END=392 /DNA_ORIENTATION=+
MAQDIEAILHDKKKLEAVAEAAFRTVDIDSSGYLDSGELEAVMKTVARDIGIDDPTPEEVEEVLVELDKNQDGKISLEEFTNMIFQVIDVLVKAQDDDY